MKIQVRSAHKYTHVYHSIKAVCSNIVMRSSDINIEPSLAIRAAKSLITYERSGEKLANPPPTFEEDLAIFKQCKGSDIEILNSCFANGIRSTSRNREIQLNVQETMTLGAFKSMLKSSCSWIPKRNLMLIPGNRPTQLEEDDNCTLDECGAKDWGFLRAFMGGTYTLNVYELSSCQFYPVPISSCFETIGSVKWKLGELNNSYIGIDELILHHDKKILEGPKNDQECPLWTLGIVRPYLREITHDLRLTRKGKHCYRD